MIEALADSDGALLSAVLDQTHDCIKLLDIEGRIQYVNQAGAMAMELSSPSKLIGQLWTDRWPPDVRPAIEAALHSVRAGESSRFKASRPQADGSRTWWDVAVTPVRTAQGEITRLLTIARDITAEVLEREHVEAISVEMRHRLKNALTVAAGLVMLSARGRPDVQAFADEIVARFSQLTAVQTLILDPTVEKHFSQIVPLLATVYGKGASMEFGELPEAKLSDQSIQALALCFGELATNSLKYGALKHGNPIRIEGALRNESLELTWWEQTEFDEARSGGQGLGLVERLIRTARGQFRREVGADHMLAVINLPVQP